MRGSVLLRRLGVCSGPCRDLRGRESRTMRAFVPEERHVSLYLQEASKRLRTMEEALAALAHGPNPSAIDTLRHCAHTLKGMSAMMGYSTLASMARTIQDSLPPAKPEGPAAPRCDLENLQRLIGVFRTGLDEISRRKACPAPDGNGPSHPLPDS